MYGPVGTSSAEVIVVLVMNRLVRLEHVGDAARAWEAREKAASRKHLFMAQYDGTFNASAQWDLNGKASVETCHGTMAASVSGW